MKHLSIILTKIPCGSGSVVEHLLAKEKVAGSNPVFRSNLQMPRSFGPRHFVVEAHSGCAAAPLGQLPLPLEAWQRVTLLPVEQFDRFRKLLDASRRFWI